MNSSRSTITKKSSETTSLMQARSAPKSNTANTSPSSIAQSTSTPQASLLGKFFTEFSVFINGKTKNTRSNYDSIPEKKGPK